MKRGQKMYSLTGNRSHRSLITFEGSFEGGKTGNFPYIKSNSFTFLFFNSINFRGFNNIFIQSLFNISLSLSMCLSLGAQMVSTYFSAAKYHLWKSTKYSKSELILPPSMKWWGYQLTSLPWQRIHFRVVFAITYRKRSGAFISN